MGRKSAPSHRTEILVAVIGLIGAIGGAIFGNWDKIFPSSEPGSDGTAGESIVSANAIVYDGNYRYDQSGLSFAKRALVAWNSGEADILVENTSAGTGSAHFFLQYDTGEQVLSGSPYDSLAKSGIVKLSASFLEDVIECPASGYQTFRVPPDIGGVYCVRSRDGAHFAKIKVIDIRADRIAFDWQYQTRPTRRFR